MNRIKLQSGLLVIAGGLMTNFIYDSIKFNLATITLDGVQTLLREEINIPVGYVFLFFVLFCVVTYISFSATIEKSRKGITQQEVKQRYDVAKFISRHLVENGTARSKDLKRELVENKVCTDELAEEVISDMLHIGAIKREHNIGFKLTLRYKSKIDFYFAQK